MNIEIIGLKFDFYFNFDFELPKDESQTHHPTIKPARHWF